jgi:hypothetical protein
LTCIATLKAIGIILWAEGTDTETNQKKKNVLIIMQRLRAAASPTDAMHRLM